MLKKRIDIIGKKCCACRNCELICPTKAIVLEKDKYGFEYPMILEEKCINCGKCYTNCPIVNTIIKKEEVYLAGAAYALDEKIKFAGSSGGLFGTFAQKILKRKGIVFGAAFDKNLVLKTAYAEKIEDLEPLYKSKYLLCNTNNEFTHIRKELEKGREVLYCSSPCQIYALKLFLKKDYPNLLLVDFVCHGVGNQSLLNNSIRYSEKKMSAKIKKVIFRYKLKNASSHYYYYYQYEKMGKINEKKELYLSFPYYNAYCKQLICREGCYDCKFASKIRHSDITIADFHEIQKYDKKIERFSGVSMFVCNTSKGKNFFEQLEGDLYIKEFDINIIYKNNRFKNEVIIPKEREEFLKSLLEDDFEDTVKKFLKPSKDLRRLIYYKSPKLIRQIIQKIILKY